MIYACRARSRRARRPKSLDRIQESRAWNLARLKIHHRYSGTRPQRLREPHPRNEAVQRAPNYGIFTLVPQAADPEGRTTPKMVRSGAAASQRAEPRGCRWIRLSSHRAAILSDRLVDSTLALEHQSDVKVCLSIVWLGLDRRAELDQRLIRPPALGKSTPPFVSRPQRYSLSPRLRGLERAQGSLRPTAREIRTREQPRRVRIGRCKLQQPFGVFRRGSPLSGLELNHHQLHQRLDPIRLQLDRAREVTARAVELSDIAERHPELLVSVGVVGLGFDHLEQPESCLLEVPVVKKKPSPAPRSTPS